MSIIPSLRHKIEKLFLDKALVKISPSWQLDGDERSNYLICHYHVSDKVAVDFNMFLSLMKNMIIDNILSRLIVTIHHH